MLRAQPTTSSQQHRRRRWPPETRTAPSGCCPPAAGSSDPPSSRAQPRSRAGRPAQKCQRREAPLARTVEGRARAAAAEAMGRLSVDGSETGLRGPRSGMPTSGAHRGCSAPSCPPRRLLLRSRRRPPLPAEPRLPQRVLNILCPGDDEPSAREVRWRLRGCGLFAAPKTGENWHITIVVPSPCFTAIEASNASRGER